MQSGTSSFKVNPWWNAALLTKNLKRFWPIWAVYGMGLVLMPLLLLLEGLSASPAYYTMEEMTNGILGFVTVGLGLTAIFSILAAMAVFSYLYNPRSVMLMHTLPLRREGLFLTNYASGLLFLVGPQVIAALLTLAATILLGTVPIGAILQWFLALVCYALFFYSFAVFCAMFTGHILALPVFYGILNFLAAGLDTLLNQLFRQFVYGFNGWSAMDTWAYRLTPFLVMLRENYARSGDSGLSLSGLGYTILYALAGLVFAALALAVYRRRALESAGDVVSVRWVKPVFKYGVTLCSAVALGSFLYTIFAFMLPSGPWPMLVLMLLSGLAGYLASEMLLRKTFRVGLRCWRGAAAFCLVLTAACAVMDFDLIGFNRPPARDAVASVALYATGTRPYDSGNGPALLLTSDEDIDAILALHSYVSDHRDQYLEALNGHSGSWSDAVTLPGGGVLYESTYETMSLELEYARTDGSVLRRSFSIPMVPGDLGDPVTPASILTRLLNEPDNVERIYRFGEHLEGTSLVSAWLDVYNTETEAWESVSIEDDGDRAALYAAMQSDLAAGRLGRRFLFDDRERFETCYTSNVTLDFYRASDKKNGGGWGRTVDISLQTTASDTLSCLEKLGVLDETHILMTHVEDAERTARLNREAEANGEVYAESPFLTEDTVVEDARIPADADPAVIVKERPAA